MYIYKAFDLLPQILADPIYYFLQRKFGGLRNFNHNISVSAGVECMRRFHAVSNNITDFNVLEVGTGRIVNSAVIFYLCGAGRVITIDLHRLRDRKMVSEGFEWIIQNHENFSKEEFINQDRLKDLIEFSKTDWTLETLDEFLNITYLAPADASALDLPDNLIDCHFSTTVLEHIEPSILEKIVIEASRVIKKEGYFIHRVDLTDHFRYNDDNLNKFNFYKFSDDEWRAISNNRYAYTNRMRVCEFESLFWNCGATSVLIEPDMEEQTLTDFIDSEEIHEKFKKFDKKSLLTPGFWTTINF